MFKKILLTVLVALAALVVVLVVVIAVQPLEFRITRTATMSAPPEIVFAQVNDFHKWVAWSPWEEIDPALKRTYDGEPAGTGAVYSWAGNADIGEGRMTVTESRPNEVIQIKLEFLKPIAATHTAEFTFRPQGDQTEVTWSMFGHNNFLAKAISLVMDMDQMVGGEFEKGLEQLRTVVEGSPKRDAASSSPQEQT